MLTDAERERRLPVWHALSDLFLDTESQPEDFDRIAATLRASGYPTDVLHRILVEEVAPAFGPNLFSVAGEWAGWSIDAVRETMTALLARPPRRVWRWLTARMLRRHLDEPWAELARRLDGVPDSPPGPSPLA
ncbi:hypothetical protein LWE61_00855 [Sphingobium sufflavum]|uniref:DUF7079 family protein n=1 Tax=Sphingobium sufflavum TaxID=1129547 RepID=UPI001F2220A7|nr:hypothetical protein [Sphingobium sufflavum]MCE7795098.1 hypothetical protein [Sphingobium sufflavum]